MSDIVNHEEAALNAEIRSPHSNLARCYLDLRAEVEALLEWPDMEDYCTTRERDKARLAEAIAWIEYAHRSDCRTVPDHNGDAYWSCDCGRDELVKNLRAAVSEEPAP